MPGRVAEKRRVTRLKRQSKRMRLGRYNTTKPIRHLAMVKSGKGFPLKMQMTHKYVQIIQMTNTTGSLATWVFSANGMYDPDITGTGHQPMYFDQMAALYDHYTVIGSKVTVQLTPIASNQAPVIFGCYKNDDSTVTPTTISELMEQTDSKYQVVNFNANKPVKFTLKWSAKKTFGGSVLGNDNLQGTASANPTEQTTYTFYTKPMDGASTVGCFANVTIQYIAIWDELRDIAGS